MEAAKTDGPSQRQSGKPKSSKDDNPRDQDLKIFSDALSRLRELGLATEPKTQAGNPDRTNLGDDGEEEGGLNKTKLEEITEAVKAMGGIWPKLQDRLNCQEDWIEEARKRALEEVLLEEEEEDKIERVKAIIRNFEVRLVQKARYKELCGPGGFHNKATHFNGRDYQKYIRKATEIANKHLKKMREIEEDRARAEMEAVRELAIATEILQPKGDDDSAVETPQNDQHYFYHHMGESYIHGMMDGEAIREKFRLKILETVFELR